MREVCGRIVEAFGSWWGMIGWLLFGGYLLLPVLLIRNPEVSSVYLVVFVLFMIWWNAEVTYQCVPGWVIALGLAMLGIGFIGRQPLLIIACWAIYWTKVRE